MVVKCPDPRVPTLGWTKGDIAATIRLVTQQQRDEIAARVRAEMERQGFTSSRLARKANLSEKTISRVINGRKDPRYDTLERIANALGVEESDLRGPRPTPLGLGAESAPSKDAPEPTQLDRIELAVSDLASLAAALQLDVREIRQALPPPGEAPRRRRSG